MESKKNDLVESLRSYGRASWQVLAFAALSGVCGCSGESAPSDPGEAIAVKSQALATPESFVRFNAVNVGVCFHGGSQEIRSIMRAAIERTWGAVTRLHFSNWSTCPANVDPTWIPIRISELSNPNAWGGNCKSGMRARQPGDPTTQFTIVTGANRVNLEAVTVHEMGHCLGATHEHQRLDTPISCQQATQTTPPTGTGPCTLDTDCASNDCGSNNRCVLRSCPGTAGCLSGFTCNAQALCVPNQCRTASDCFGSSFCINGRCSTSCSTNSQCPSTHFCDTFTGRCVDGNTVIDTHAQNLTPWDPTSIMLYDGCRTSTAPEPSFWDIYGMRQLYGQRGLNQIVTSRSPGGDFTAGNPPPTGYALAYAEGWGWGRGMPGTTPLQVYFHSGRGDRMVVGTAASRTEAVAAGYLLEGTISNVYASDQGTATVALERYRSAGGTGTENATTASPTAKQNLLSLGYALVRVEGYVFPASDHPSAVDGGIPFETLTIYYSPSRNDTLLTKTGSALALEAEAEGYEHRGLDGITLKRFVEGTTRFRQFWHNGRTDHFEAATTQGINAAITDGYREVTPHEGYVFEFPQNDTQALRLYWKPSVVDNWTTAERTNTSGYTFVRNEGYVMPTLW
jgi:hypothetical protein